MNAPRQSTSPDPIVRRVVDHLTAAQRDLVEPLRQTTIAPPMAPAASVPGLCSILWGHDNLCYGNRITVHAAGEPHRVTCVDL
jgi:hypothetical protein